MLENKDACSVVPQSVLDLQAMYAEKDKERDDKKNSRLVKALIVSIVSGILLVAATVSGFLWYLHGLTVEVSDEQFYAEQYGGGNNYAAGGDMRWPSEYTNESEP